MSRPGRAVKYELSPSMTAVRDFQESFRVDPQWCNDHDLIVGPGP
jgi:hypothetical protein